MTKYILILWIMVTPEGTYEHQNYPSRDSGLATASFYTKDSCEKALTEIRYKTKVVRANGGIHNLVTGLCVIQ